MSDPLSPPPRTPNPVQKVQGYVEIGSTQITTTDLLPGTVNVQEIYPGAKVRVFYSGTNTDAYLYDSNGNRALTNQVTADRKGMYSFYVESGQYDVKFFDPNIPPTEPQVEVAETKKIKIESRTFNVRDYGARGDNNADDWAAILAAIDAMKAANSDPQQPDLPINGVGTLFFPNGQYRVTRPIDLPSGITVQGTNGQYAGNAISNCMIVLTEPEQSIFRIDTNRQRIIIRDLGMTTLGVDILPGTKAIDGTRNIAGGTVTGIEFDNLTIWGFDRGISVEGSDGADQWDFNNVKVNHCNIGECNYSIYLNSQNCDFWRIADSRIGAALLGDGIHLEKVGIITIDSVLGAGSVREHPHRTARSFIYLTPAHGTVTIINCENEGFLFSMRLSAEVESNIGWPIVVLNSALGAEVLLGHNCDYISLGNRYLPGTVKCVEQGNNVMIYSLGDIFARNEDDAPQDDPQYDFVLHGDSRVVSRANRYRVDFQRPARFGGQVGPRAETLADTALSVSPFSSGEAQMALCNPAGDVIFHVRAEEGFLYFENSAHKRLMSLDNKEGNLVIAGTLTQNGTL